MNTDKEESIDDYPGLLVFTILIGATIMNHFDLFPGDLLLTVDTMIGISVIQRIYDNLKK